MRRSPLIFGAATMLGLGLTMGSTAAASAGTPPPPPDTHTVLPNVPSQGVHTAGSTIQAKSTNWSGYADVGATGKFSKVTNKFVVPQLTCNPSVGGNGYEQVSIWNGMDGWSDGQVEQGGVDGYCYQGQGPYYDTWWEHYPVNNEQPVGTTVKAGDHISVATTRSGTKYTVKVTDSTTPGNSFTHSFSCAATTCTDTSAEFIVEAPGGDSGEPGSLYPLVQFAPMSMTSAVVNSGNIKSYSNNEITMVDYTNSSIVKAKPGALNSTGNAFSDTWESSGP